MKKIIKNKIFICLIVGICCLGIGIYASNTYEAKDVLYNTSSGDSITVNEALNELYKSILKNNNRYIIGTFEAGTMSDRNNLRNYDVKFSDNINFQVKSILIVFVNPSGAALKIVYKSENAEWISSSGHLYRYSFYNTELNINNNGFSFTTQHGWMYGTAYYIAFENNALDDIPYSDYYQT